MCFLIPSFFTSIFVIGVAILPTIGTVLAVALAFFVIITIFKALFSSKKTESNEPLITQTLEKTYQLPDEEFDMTKEIVENKQELKREEPVEKVPIYKDEFKIVYFVIAAMVLAVFVLVSNNKKKSESIEVEQVKKECTTNDDCPTNYSCRSKKEGGTNCQQREDIAFDSVEIKPEKTKKSENTKPTPDPTDSNYIKVCNNGQVAGQGTCPKSPILGSNPTDWACTKDKKTGLIWEVKTDDGGLRDKDWAYSWYEPDDKKNGGFAGYKNGNSTVGSGGNCLTPSNCNTNDFTADVNATGLCGFKDWRMPTRDEQLTLLHCASNQNTSPKKDSEFNRLCTDEALKDAPNINKNYFPNTASHFWTSTLTNNDPWVVVFSYGGANSDNKQFDSPVRLVRNDKPKLAIATIKNVRFQKGKFAKEPCESEYGIGECLCESDINYPIVTGLVNKIEQAKLNKKLKAVATEYKCDGIFRKQWEKSEEEQNNSEIKVSYAILFNTPDALVISQDSYSFGYGAAHGISQWNTYIIDVKSGKNLSPFDIFGTNISEVNRHIYNSLKKEELIFEDEVEKKKDKFLDKNTCNGCVLLPTKKGMKIIFDESGIAASAAGRMEIIIPANYISLDYLRNLILNIEPDKNLGVNELKSDVMPIYSEATLSSSKEDGLKKEDAQKYEAEVLSRGGSPTVAKALGMLHSNGYR
jgi:hypothetical protein